MSDYNQPIRPVRRIGSTEPEDHTWQPTEVTVFEGPFDTIDIQVGQKDGYAIRVGLTYDEALDHVTEVMKFLPAVSAAAQRKRKVLQYYGDHKLMLVTVAYVTVIALFAFFAGMSVG